MTKNAQGWMVFLAALGMMATLVSADIQQIQTWSEVFAPTFVGTTLAHFGAVTAAFLAGRLQPTS